jgi:protein ImuA
MQALARSSLLESLPAQVWRADALAGSAQRVLGTGWALLDEQLPGGGWPLGAMIEILQEPLQHNEWNLLLPALAACGHGPVILVAAPHSPFAAALAHRGLPASRLLWVNVVSVALGLWATEQALRCAEVNAIMAWLPRAQTAQLRRLQMAAAEHAKLLVVMRPAAAQQESSPAVLRLGIAVREQADHSAVLEVRIHKRRGPPLNGCVRLPSAGTGLSRLIAAHPSTRLGTGESGLRAKGVHHALDRFAANA